MTKGKIYAYEYLMVYSIKQFKGLGSNDLLEVISFLIHQQSKMHSTY